MKYSEKIQYKWEGMAQKGFIWNSTPQNFVYRLKKL